LTVAYSSERYFATEILYSAILMSLNSTPILILCLTWLLRQEQLILNSGSVNITPTFRGIVAFEPVDEQQRAVMADIWLIIVGVLMLIMADVFKVVVENMINTAFFLTYNALVNIVQTFRIVALMLIAAGITIPLTRLIYDWLRYAD